MEMPAVWKERKSKKPFPSLPTPPWKARKQPRASHIPTASAATWISLFLQARLTSTSTKVLPTSPVPFVTDIPGRTTKHQFFMRTLKAVWSGRLRTPGLKPSLLVTERFRRLESLLPRTKSPGLAPNTLRHD